MLAGLRARSEWKLFGALPRADRTLAAAWWVVLVLRGILPALFAIAIGMLVGAVQRGEDLVGPLAFMGSVFVTLQVLPPIHQAVGSLLGSRLAAWLYDRLTIACVRPPGMGHLEDPKLTGDLSMARGVPQLNITVVPDSGTGELAGLAGRMTIAIADGNHSYEFEYTIDEAP